MRNKRTTMTLAALSAAVLAACGGGGGGGDTGDRTAGIGGTGTGGVSGFASVLINEDRKLTTDDVTPENYTLDGEPISRAVFEDPTRYTGMVVRYTSGSFTDVAGTATAAATTIEAINQVKGPVTGTAPLEVLGQEVVCTGDTFLDNLASCAALTVGQFAEVAGFTDGTTAAGDVILATRVERKAASPLVWKIRGIAKSVTASQFTIGNQLVQIGGVTPRDCVGGLANGDLVEVKASQDPGFIPGGALDTVTDIECETTALDTANPSATVIDASIEGLVTTIDLPGQTFTIGDQTVDFSSAVFVGGTPGEDLIVGVKVEAEGEVEDGGGLNTSTGILKATEVEFRQRRVRIIAPMSPSDVVLNTSFQILGIDVIGMPNTDDPDGILAGTFSANSEIEVRGFVDGSGTVYAEEIVNKDDGNGSLFDVRLRGPATDINQGAGTFKVLGITVDATSAASWTVEGAAAPATDLAGFMSALAANPGRVVDVQNADFGSSGGLVLETAELTLEE